MTSKTKFRLALVGVIVVILLVAGMATVNIETVAGNEMGVQEDWTTGVHDKAYTPRTYFLVPGFSRKMYTYDMSSQVYVMNDKTSSEGEFGRGREKDSYLVQSKEGQDMHISMQVRWKLNREHLVKIHKEVRNNFEEKLLRPVLMRVVKDAATQKEAVDAYSGSGLVELQATIETALLDPEGEMARSGIIVENFVIEGIELDPDYIAEIKGRQIALQTELRAMQEEKAALAEAQKAKAEAQADYEKQVVEAERDKAVGVLEAEKSAEQQILAADAAKQQAILAAEGEKESSVLRAEAIIALGEAEAKAKTLELTAYGAPGAENWVKVEVAKSMAEGFGQIKGYLPENMQVFTLGESFNKAVEAVVGPKKP
jgi:regulator of protease activity HflC (stomatin/prohibitin superfamily)